MTKLHEEFVRGLLSEIIENLKKRPQIKGECTLLIAARNEKESISWEEIRIEIRSALESNVIKISEIAKHLAKKYHLPKQRIYEEALKIRRQQSEDR
jgi:16S rRNA (cytidine1402-2'-O)-methyltransferase